MLRRNGCGLLGTIVILLSLALCLEVAPTYAAEGEIVLGVCEPLSGPMKDVGDRYLEAVKFAVEKINAKGGILGKKLKVVAEDSQLKADVATRKATKLILEDKADFIMTGTGTHVCKAMMKVAEQNKKICLTYGTEGASTTGADFNPYTFRTCLNTDQHSAAVVEYFAKHTNYKKFYILCQDYAFGREAAEGFKKKLKSIPGSQVLGEEFHPIGLKDFAPYISKVMSAGQLTLPKRIREAMGLEGSEYVVVALLGGAAVIRRLREDNAVLEAIRRKVKKSGLTRARLEDLVGEAARKAWKKRYREAVR